VCLVARPKGVKEIAPRMKRLDYLNARREDWDRWETRNGALKRARRVLMEIMEDPGVNARDRLKAVEMLETRGMGRPGQEQEQAAVTVLQIIRASADGYERLNPGQTWEATTVEDLTAELPAGEE